MMMAMRQSVCRDRRNAILDKLSVHALMHICIYAYTILQLKHACYIVPLISYRANGQEGGREGR